MYYSKDIESFGTGLHKIAMECEGAGVRYGFELGKLGFSVIFYRPGIYYEATMEGNGVVNSVQNGAPRDTNNHLQGDLDVDLDGVTIQVNIQDERIAALLEFCGIAQTREKMQEYIGISNRGYFRSKILKPLLDAEKLKMTIPDKPNSRNQKYIAVPGTPRLQ